MKSFRDPVYDYINCGKGELSIIDSPWFQRLRHCSQNGPARLVYPTLVGSRFEHSLGVMHLANKMLCSVLNSTQQLERDVYGSFLEKAEKDIKAFYVGDKPPVIEIKEQLVHWVRLAGLCHDIGHFPLSHTLENVFEELFWGNAFPNSSPKRACHEVLSAEVVRQIAFRYGEDDIFSSIDNEELISTSDARAIILLLLLPRGVYIGDCPIEYSVFSTLHEIIVGTYDADRLDYLQRDSHLASASIGLIDIERFLDSLRLVKCTNGFDESLYYYRIRPSAKAISAIEAILLERYKQKKWIHFYHKVVFYDRMVKEAGVSILKKAQDCFFRVIKISDIYSKDVNELELPHAYREQLNLQLSGQTEEDSVGPLSIYRIGNHPRYSVLDCQKLVNNPVSHFIDDIWFSQQCREHLKTSYLSDLLVDRKPMGISIWKTPDLFETFWRNFSSTLDNSEDFWKALGLEDRGGLPKRACDRPMENLLLPIFRDESDQYSEFFGVQRVAHSQEIEDYLTKNVSICSGDISAKMAYVRWKNLFFDVHSGELPKIYGQGGRQESLNKYSGLIESLVGLRGEILFYIYLVGKEQDILKLKKSDKFSDINNIVKNFAKHFADVIIKSLNDHCKASEENRKFAVKVLSEG